MRQGLIILTILALTGCNKFLGERGNGVRVSQTYVVDDFNQIAISGTFEVTLIPSGDNKIVLETDENLIEYIDIKVMANRLYIGSGRRLVSRLGIALEIPVKNLNRLEISGAASVVSKDQLNANELVLEVSGAGNLDLQLDVKFVSLEVSGATAVYLEGAAKRLEVDMSGAGTLDAENFEVEECSVDISGVGNALVNVSGTLEARVSGLGKVAYVGNPEKVKGDVSGIGDIDKVRN